MDISIVVISYNEEDNIGKCLKTLVSQDYSPDKYEIIVVDGGSTDKTQWVIKEFAKVDSRVRLVIERKKGAAAGRNAGVRSARYDYVAFTDSDCEAPSNWLSLLADAYMRVKSKYPNVAGVGGRNIAPSNAGDFVKAVEIAMDSYIGSFGSIQGKQLKAPTFVKSLSTANVLYDKMKIVEIGYFDESLISEAEDADINYRLFSAGSRFLFIPDSFVWHKMRQTPSKWIRNMFRYGKGRGRLLKRYRHMWNVSYILPILFIGVILSIFAAPFSQVFYIPALYFPAILCFSLFQCARRRSLYLAPKVALVYYIQHFGYASGQIYGLLNPEVK